MTLRARVTLLTALLILVSTSLLGALAYVTSSRLQYDSIDNSLASVITDARIRSLATNPRPVPDDVYSPFALARVNRDGTVTVLRQAGLGSDPLPFPQLSAESIDAASVSPVSVTGTPSYRVLVRQPPNRATVIAAAPLGDVESNLARLAAVIIASVLAVTLIGGVAAWAIVRRFFRPVDAMVDAAQAISLGDTQRRVPTARPGTELGELSESLNLMIGSLTTSIATVEASEERLRAFVSDASHEIRTPLTVIRGYVELLQREESGASELSTRALERIESESRRLERLVTQLLLLERMDDLSVSAFASVDLAEIVRDGFDDLAALNPDRRVDMDLEPAALLGLEDAWRQLVANIVQNCTRHTPAGSPIQVALHQAGGQTTLIVDDAGPGIPLDQRAHALERFSRLDPSRSTATGGFGLGMSIMRAVVDAHGGSIDLLDSPLGGLRLVITVGPPAAAFDGPSE
jgi:two-component system OmpR family sensor kinase